MKRVYIAGPMTGLPDLNFPAFHAMAARMRSLGFEVVNPAEINVDPGLGWVECMKRDIVELITCDGIALLPGWERSRGARLELRIAEELGLKVRLAVEFETEPSTAAMDDLADWGDTHQEVIKCSN